MKTFVCTNSYAGYREIECEIVSETKDYCKVRLLQSALISQKQCETGDIVRVPKYAIKKGD